jgi:choice-of-anchor A domain-containing protein
MAPERQSLRPFELAEFRRSRPARVRAKAAAAFAMLLSAVPGVPALADGRLFVSNYSDDTVAAYSQDVDGDVAPSAIFFTETGPHQLAVWRSQSELFVVNNQSYSVTVYDSETGVLKRRIAGPNTGLVRPTGVAVDEVNAELYVANDFGNSVTVYGLLADGDIAPARMLAGSATGLGGPVGVAVDPVTNELFVANYRVDGSGSITVFARTASGNTAPLRTIQGNATGLNLPQALSLDPVYGEIFVASSGFTTANVGAILVFRRTDSGNVAPLRKIEGASTGLCNPVGLALSVSRDELAVANSNFGSGSCDESVTTYAAGDSGNSAPLRVLAGEVSSLSHPTGVAICEECLCESANPVVDGAGLCTVFQMGAGKVTMSSGDPTGDFGNLCMAGGSLSLSGGQIVKGDAYLGANVVKVSTWGPTAIQGDILRPFDLTTQVNAAKDASTSKGALACDQSLGDLKTARTIAATRSGENVICVNNIALNQVVTLSAAGHRAVSFVINVKGGFALSSGPGGQIRVQAPLEAKDVLVNVLGTGQDVKFSGGGNVSVVDGTILAPYRKISIAPGRVNGQIMSTLEISLSGGAIVECPSCQ